MDKRLENLYTIPERVVEQDIYLLDELEFQSVKVAMEFGKHLK